jgi:hypothetical protein
MAAESDNDGNPSAIAADNWALADALAEAPAPPAAPNVIANDATVGGKENEIGGSANKGPNDANCCLQMQSMISKPTGEFKPAADYRVAPRALSNAAAEWVQ